jgi:protein-S-isoprenylcysteine O-methyltransferase Ste14
VTIAWLAASLAIAARAEEPTGSVWGRSAINPAQAPEEIDRRRVGVLFVTQYLFLALLLFISAGDFGWRKGWLYLLVNLTLSAVVVPFIWHVNPGILVARIHMRWVKRWDKILVSITIVPLAAVFVVAALDDGRFHWLPIPRWLCAAGYVLFFLGMGIGTWTGAVNKFAEGPVRIQTERGHTVVDSGPYAIVRHPGYVGAFFLFVGTALALGSLWALIPVGFVMGLLILRTQWEDQTLQAELSGYKEYTARVRYKLIPGVW